MQSFIHQRRSTGSKHSLGPYKASYCIYAYFKKKNSRISKRLSKFQDFEGPRVKGDFQSLQTAWTLVMKFAFATHYSGAATFSSPTVKKTPVHHERSPAFRHCSFREESQFTGPLARLQIRQEKGLQGSCSVQSVMFHTGNFPFLEESSAVV